MKRFKNERQRRKGIQIVTHVRELDKQSLKTVICLDCNQLNHTSCFYDNLDNISAIDEIYDFDEDFAGYSVEDETL